jgi:hypothetical protein
MTSVNGVSRATAKANYKHLTWENSVSEDRHNPLPHIALSTTALKSAYRKTAPIATHPATELRELQALGGLEWQHPGSPRCAF